MSEEIGYTTIDQLDPAEALAGGEAIHGIQNEVDVKITPLQLKTYLGTGAVVKTGTCATAAATSAKAITLNDYKVADNDIIAITFTYGNSYGDPSGASTFPTLSITDSEGTKSLAVCDSCGHHAGAGCWNAGDRIEFRIANDCSNAIMLNTDVRQVKDGIIYYSDGRTVYNKSTVDSVLNSALGDLFNSYTVLASTNATSETNVSLSDNITGYKLLVFAIRWGDSPYIYQTSILPLGMFRTSNRQMFVENVDGIRARFRYVDTNNCKMYCQGGSSTTYAELLGIK